MCVLEVTLITMGGQAKIFEHIAPAHEYRKQLAAILPPTGQPQQAAGPSAAAADPRPPSAAAPPAAADARAAASAAAAAADAPPDQYPGPASHEVDATLSDLAEEDMDAADAAPQDPLLTACHSTLPSREGVSLPQCSALRCCPTNRSRRSLSLRDVLFGERGVGVDDVRGGVG